MNQSNCDLIDKFKTNATPVFVGGTGRSGSTILSKFIAGHSLMYRLPFESRFIIDPDGVLDLIFALSVRWSPYIGSKSIERFFSLIKKIFTKEPLLRRIARNILGDLFPFSVRGYRSIPLEKEINEDDLVEKVKELYQKLVISEFKGIWYGKEEKKRSDIIYVTRSFPQDDLYNILGSWVTSVFSGKCRELNAHMWIDHTPYSMLHATELQKLFPGGKFIFIYRDPRDIVASYLRVRWGAEDVSKVVSWIEGIYQNWDMQKKRIATSSFIEVKLEDLVDTPIGIAREICTFLNVDFEADMLKIDLSKHNKHRWRKELSPQEIYMIENRLGNQIRAQGYV